MRKIQLTRDSENDLSFKFIGLFGDGEKDMVRDTLSSPKLMSDIWGDPQRLSDSETETVEFSMDEVMDLFYALHEQEITFNTLRSFAGVI